EKIIGIRCFDVQDCISIHYIGFTILCGVCYFFWTCKREQVSKDYSIVGNTITMRMDFMDKLMEKVSGVAADRAVEKYREEMMRDEKMGSKSASKKLGVSKATIIRYITNGKKIGGRT